MSDDDKQARRRWREEMESAWLYRQVADAEPDPANSRLFRALARASETQAAVVARGLGPLPDFRPSWRARLVAAIVRRLTPARSRRLLAAMHVRGLSVYAAPPGPHPMPTDVAEVGRRHRGTGGGALRAAVFGVNDGLVSNTCLILGMAGATADVRLILLSGAAGLLAGAFSMAAGEYVSVRSQREFFEYQIGQEREELARYPDEEAEELALIYAARGVPLDQARDLSRRLLDDPQRALDTLAREELGLNPDDLGSPWRAALASFAAFAAGASLPLLPFLLAVRPNPVLWSVGLAAAALFAVGAALSLFSGRGALWGGLRMLAIGGSAGLATFLTGRLLGVGLA
ncbi:MAG: VIT1/CCC1 transporter family protein [Pseudomonadota bacterium]|nr:VIT1/CCC1 transporter family protein [Pseudomonadota bacterium]